MLLLLGVWLAYSFPAFAGNVYFPMDLARELQPKPGPTGRPKVHNPLEVDAVVFYHPWRTYLGERIRDGGLPLWDPHRLVGMPAAANTQMAVFYPPNWLYAFGGVLAVYTLLRLAATLGALLLMYWFLRVLDLHRYAAVAGATVFTFSGFLIAWGMHPTFIDSAMWLPLVLGGLHLAVGGRFRRGIPLAAIGLALSVVGGHAQVTMFVAIAAGLWSLVAVIARSFDARAGGPAAVRRTFVQGATRCAVAVALGVGLSAPQLWSSTELAEFIVRQPTTYETFISHALPPEQLMTLPVAERLGNPLHGNHVGKVNYTESTLYAGALTLALAAVALWRRRDRATAGFALIALAGGLCAFGTPVYRLFFETVPGLAQTRSGGRILFLLDVGLAGLCALGLDEVLRRRRGTLPALLGAGIFISLAAVAMLFVGRRSFPVETEYLLPRVLFAVTLVEIGIALAVSVIAAPARSRVLGAGIVAVLACDLWAFGFFYHRFQEPGPVLPAPSEVEVVQALPDVRPRTARMGFGFMQLNVSLLYGLYDVQGTDAFVLSHVVDLISVAQDVRESARALNVVGAFRADAFGSPVLDMLGVRAIFAPPGLRGPGRPVHSDIFAVQLRQQGFPPAFLTSCWRTVAARDALREVASLSAAQLRTTSVVDGVGPPGGIGPSCPPQPVPVVSSYQPERVTVAVRAERPSVLVLTDAWYPGWTVTVDGTRADLLKTNGALRGVAVEPGSHTVEFAYRPRWLVAGGAVAVFCLLLLAALAFGIGPRRAAGILAPPSGPAAHTM